jgi:hypothetical protein
LHAGGVGAEQIHGFAHGRQRGRADVGTLGVAEEHDHGLAAEIGEAGRLAMMVGEAEILAPIDRRQIGGDEARRLGTPCQQQGDAQVRM